jgi:hypothetical protein
MIHAPLLLPTCVLAAAHTPASGIMCLSLYQQSTPLHPTSTAHASAGPLSFPLASFKGTCLLSKQPTLLQRGHCQGNGLPKGLNSKWLQVYLDLVLPLSTVTSVCAPIPSWSTRHGSVAHLPYAHHRKARSEQKFDTKCPARRSSSNHTTSLNTPLDRVSLRAALTRYQRLT